MNKLLFSLSASPKSLVEELWDYFVENYLESERVYDNLGISTEILPMLLVGIFIGAIIATFVVIYDNRVVGEFVRKMAATGVVGKEKAQTLRELGTNERSSFARALRTSVGLRRVVRCVEEENYYAELEKTREEYEKKREEDSSLPKFKSVDYKFDGTEHFYIPEDKRIAAEVKFANRGMKIWAIPVIIVVAVIGFFGFMLLVPYMLQLLDQMVGSFKSF